MASNPHYAHMCHLRRILPEKDGQPSIASINTSSLILLDTYIKFGRNHDLCDVVLTSSFSSSNMISRDHAEIHGVKSASGRIEKYMITDHSLNGTYINDRRCRANNETPIIEGDIIKFGHMNGASIKDGMDAPQANAEFAFIVERANPAYTYLGFRDGRRSKPIVCKGDTEQCYETEIQRKNTIPQHQSPQVGPPPSTVAAAAAAAATAAQNNSMNNLLTQQLSALYSLPYSQLPNIFGSSWGQLQSGMSGMPGISGFRAPNVWPTTGAVPNHLGLPPSTSANIFNRNILQAGNPLMNSLLTPVTAATVAAAAVSTPGVVPTPETILATAASNAAVLAHGKVHAEEHKESHKVFKTEAVSTNNKLSSPQMVKSPPMECDSSVPSPPKAPVQLPKPAPSPKRGDRSDAESPPIVRRTAAPAPWDSTPSPKPRDTPDSVNDTRTKEKDGERESKKTSAAPVVKHRKTNEIARLLEDITETSFVNQMRRASTSRRPTEEEILEKHAKKEKKKKEKEKAKKDLQREDRGRPPAVAPTLAASRVPPSRRMKQLSDESSASSDSDSDDEPVARNPIPAVKKETQKRKRQSSVSSEEETASQDSDDSSKPAKKGKKSKGKYFKKEVTKEEKKIPAKRGRKPKAALKPASSSDEEVEEEENLDDEGGVVTTHDPASRCEMGAQCTTPQSSKVNWICCDDCDKWYHNICILGQEEELNQKHFFCGCKKRDLKGKKKGRK